MTIKELHAAIKEQTIEVNKRLVEYYEAGGNDKLVNKEIQYLRDVTGTSNRSSFISMRTHRKRKAELEAQLSELRYFNEWDIFTPRGMAERTRREQQAWRSYKRNTGSRLQFDTWRKMVTIMGTIGKDIFNQFGGSYSNVIEEAVRKGRKPGEVINTLQQVVKDNEGKGKSTTDYLDDLIQRLDITV